MYMYTVCTQRMQENRYRVYTCVLAVTSFASVAFVAYYSAFFNRYKGFNRYFDELVEKLKRPYADRQLQISDREDCKCLTCQCFH